jgi:drug/metabolite transporter (DMT)-like permease
MAQVKGSDKNSNAGWILLAVAMLLLTLPNGIFVKLIGNEIDYYLIGFVRWALAGIVLIPFIVDAFVKHRKLMLKNLPLIIGAFLLIALGGPLQNAAIVLSSVSFTEIVSLLIPIVFAIVSILATKDRLSRYAVTGLLLAILGAMVITVMPILLGRGAIIEFGWMPLAFMLVHVVASAVVPVFLRKQNEKGLPLTALVGISFLLTSIVCAVFMIFDTGIETFKQITNLSVPGWLMMAYTAIVVSVVVRPVRVKIYEHIGTLSEASLSYLYHLLAIALPLVLLGEWLSWELIVGGVLIVFGTIMTRKHHRKQQQVKIERLV